MLPPKCNQGGSESKNNQYLLRSSFWEIRYLLQQRDREGIMGFLILSEGTKKDQYHEMGKE